MDSLVVVREAAKLLGVSDDLVCELTSRGELPSLRFGRRKLIPRRAIELVIESALSGFEAESVIARVSEVGPEPAGLSRYLGEERPGPPPRVPRRLSR